MSTISKKWLAMTLIFYVGVSFFSSCSNDDEQLVQMRIKQSPYVGVWASSRVLESQTDGDVVAFELRADGTGADGIWNYETGSFTPEDYIWEWAVDGDQFYHIENGYTLSRTVEMDESGMSYTIYDDDDPKKKHYETFVKLR